MIILRRKRFSLQDPKGQQGDQVEVQIPDEVNKNVPTENQNNVTSEVTSRNLLLQQMKLQKQVLQSQLARKKLEQQENLANMRQLQQQQKQENEKNEKQASTSLKIKKSTEDGKKMNDNTSLYKTKSQTVPPISMFK